MGLEYNSNIYYMKIQNLEELALAIEKNQNYAHEIKGKRLRKEIKTLSETHFEDIKFASFQVKDVAIYMNVLVLIDDKSQLELCLRLDREYPFNPPQVFFRTDPDKSQYGYCKDLLNTILKGQQWGPSLTLPMFLQKLPSLASILKNKQKIVWTYHLQFEYGTQQLKKSGIKLYEVEQYKWEYKILKLKTMKVLGFSPDCLLKFERVSQDNNILKLDFWIPIKNVAEVQAKTSKKNFQLQLDYTQKQTSQKMYLGGDISQLQSILDSLNPIQMIERKVKNFQKSGIKDYNDAIQSYSTLVQHYSLTNKELTQKYMTSMKKIIESHYQEGEKQEKVNKMVEING